MSGSSVTARSKRKYWTGNVALVEQLLHQVAWNEFRTEAAWGGGQIHLPPGLLRRGGHRQQIAWKRPDFCRTREVTDSCLGFSRNRNDEQGAKRPDPSLSHASWVFAQQNRLSLCGRLCAEL
jgi:hypothetical protein